MIGSKLTNYLSNWLIVTTQRDGKRETVSFEEGKFKDRSVGIAEAGARGTVVEWKPSAEFFTYTKVDIEKIKSLLSTLVCLCKGLTINLTIDNDEPIKYHSDRGLNDLVDNIANKEILNKRFEINYKHDKYELDFVLTYTSGYSSTIIPYVNTGLTEGGQHITQVKSAITRVFNKFFKDKKWLKDKDSLSGDELQEGLYVVFNMVVPSVAYDSQIKTKISKIDTKSFVQEITKELELWVRANEKEAKKIFDKAVTAKKAKDAAKKARDRVREKGKKEQKGLRGKMQISDKFTDCISTNPKERNLLLVEGNSAAGSAIEARNVHTDCIYALRGKIISPLKQTVDKILANQEMSDIINLIGAGFGNDKFDVNKMKFNKIVITSDQDSDGAAISLLLITFFYTFMRPLVLEGKLYRAVTPLYIVTTKKEKYYCYSEQELEQWKNSHKEKYELSHCKG